MKKRKLLSALISSGSFSEFVESIFFLVNSQKSSYVCISNVHMVIEAYKSKEFSKALNEADLASPDGYPIYKMLNLLYNARTDKISGPDLFPVLMREAAERGKKVFFYGSTHETLTRIAERARKENPGLEIAGYYSPPFRRLTPDEDGDVVNMINGSGADLVFVSLGCPKQEMWMAEHKDKINGCMLGVGQAFGIYAGMMKRAPKLMQKMSLEWLYRLMQEPGRLWRRYLETNLMFIMLMFKVFIIRGFTGKNISIPE